MFRRGESLTVWLSWEKHSRRTPILIQRFWESKNFTAHLWAAICRTVAELRNVVEGPVCTRGSLHLLLMSKQRYSSRVRCQLPDVCLRRWMICFGARQRGERNVKCVCACVGSTCASSRWDSRLSVRASSHRMCSTNDLAAHVLHVRSAKERWMETRDWLYGGTQGWNGVRKSLTHGALPVHLSQFISLACTHAVLTHSGVCEILATTLRET